MKTWVAERLHALHLPGKWLGQYTVLSGASSQASLGRPWAMVTLKVFGSSSFSQSRGTSNVTTAYKFIETVILAP